MADTTMQEAAGAAQPAAAKEIESLRLLNQVELVGETDEGKGVDHLPNGVYGFSWAPQQEAPLFRQHGFQSFEVHKAPDGAVYWVGYVTEADARLLATAKQEIQLNFYPEPWQQAVKVACIPTARVNQAKGPARVDGNPLKLHIGPDQSTVQ